LSRWAGWHDACAIIDPKTDGNGSTIRSTKEGIAMDDEAVGLRHELAASDAAVCELCGRPIARTGLSDLPVDRGMGEPVEAIRVCPSCNRMAEAEELPYDAEIVAGLRDADG
jgi:hypothetical protein